MMHLICSGRDRYAGKDAQLLSLLNDPFAPVVSDVLMRRSSFSCRLT